MLQKIQLIPGARLITHAVIVLAVWLVVTAFLGAADDLMNYYVALVAMYATAMFGMVILVGLSGQVSLGNGALMAVGGYVFALTSLHWQTVPIFGWQWNAIWSMVFAGLGGVVIGLLLGFVGARLKGPYLAGLTLGVAVGFPAIANRFPSLLGGENGLILSVPYPAGGYAPTEEFLDDDAFVDEQFLDEVPLEEEVSAEGFDDLAPVEEITAEGFDDLAPVEEITAEGFDDLAPVEEITAEGFDDLAPVEEITAEGLDDLPLDDGSQEEFPVEGDIADVTGIEEFLDPGIIVERYQASIALTAAVLMGFIALNLVRGRQGRVWRAVRDDSVAAAVSGVFPAGAKVSAFVVSSVFAAIAGAVLAQILAYVGPGAFGLGLSLSLLVGVVLGGRMSLFGAILGAILLVWLPEFVLQVAGERGWSEQVTNNAPNLLYGLLVVFVVLLLPGGIMGTLGDWVKKRRMRG
jgi:ABC-type branched-subunit amino acid transport system permease subunit